MNLATLICWRHCRIEDSGLSVWYEARCQLSSDPMDIVNVCKFLCCCCVNILISLLIASRRGIIVHCKGIIRRGVKNDIWLILRLIIISEVCPALTEFCFLK